MMTRDLSPLSLLQNLQMLQITSFNDPVRYPIPPAVLTVTSLRELSLRTLGLDLIQVTPPYMCRLCVSCSHNLYFDLSKGIEWRQVTGYP